MKDACTRKEFFRFLLSDPIKTLIGAGVAASGPASTIPEEMGSVTADFSSVFLDEEARNLGLDPKSMDRRSLERAIRRKMEEMKPPGLA